MIQLKFIPILACIALACDPTVASAQHQAHDSTADILADFEAEAERRRSEEGDNFDEESYQFERSIMERRIDLEQQLEAISQALQDLDRELNEFHNNRQREDMQNRQADFEAEAERRRGEEGDNFDEESYQFERAIMERRAQLDEQRIAIDEEFNRKRDELSKSPNGQDQNAWQELDREQQRAFEALDEEYQTIEQERKKYWDDREDDDE